ncbi:unnamed protein product, partial [Rotaria sordida]
EATNGLAILLPASKDNFNDLTNNQNSNRTSTPLTTKRVNGMIKDQRAIDNVKSD